MDDGTLVLVDFGPNAIIPHERCVSCKYYFSTDDSFYTTTGNFLDARDGSRVGQVAVCLLRDSAMGWLE